MLYFLVARKSSCCNLLSSAKFVFLEVDQHGGISWHGCCCCWKLQEQNALEASKDLLAAPQVLAHYDPQFPLVLACDASPYGLGAVLADCYSDGSEKPVTYVSCAWLLLLFSTGLKNHIMRSV